MFKSALTISTGLLLSFNAQALDLAGTIFGEVEKESGISSELLYAVALTESANGAGKSKVSPSAFAYRTPEGSKYFKTRLEAEAALRIDISKGIKLIDVGMMQINLHYHKQDDPYSLFDPKTNLRVAAKILATALTSTDDITLGIGRYHSWKNKRAINYGRRVLSIYKNLKNI
jgi:hypothetical protein